MTAAALALAVVALILAAVAACLSALAYFAVRNAPVPKPLLVPSNVADRLTAESEREQDEHIHLLLSPDFSACQQIVPSGTGVLQWQASMVTCPVCREYMVSQGIVEAA